MSIIAGLKQLGAQLNGRSLRERVFILLTGLVILLVLWDALLLQPLRRERSDASIQLQQVAQRQSDLATSLATLEAESRRDPNQELRLREQELQTDINTLSARISTLHGGISNPRQSLTTLATLLADRSGLSLVTLENLPAEPLTNREGDTPVATGLYIHRVRLVLDSNFHGVLDYLSLLNDLPGGVFWESFELSVPEWPTNRAELILYSIAAGDAWLGV